MENDEYLKDDFLRELIQRSPLDSPSDDFVERVMANINLSPEVVAVRKPLYLHLKSAVPYAVLALVVFIVLATSDLPVFNWIPGKDYLIGNMLTYLGTLFTIFKSAFAARYVSWVLLISISAGVLFFIDGLFSRRTSA
ncbi:MAG: hypothetical protein NT040_04775 [Bacteroidetes bacterium]|nr:hypothetical protein [Bacteroidota bacterium]